MASAETKLFRCGVSSLKISATGTSHVTVVEYGAKQNEENPNDIYKKILDNAQDIYSLKVRGFVEKEIPLNATDKPLDQVLQEAIESGYNSRMPYRYLVLLKMSAMTNILINASLGASASADAMSEDSSGSNSGVNFGEDFKSAILRLYMFSENMPKADEDEYKKANALIDILVSYLDEMYHDRIQKINLDDMIQVGELTPELKVIIHYLKKLRLISGDSDPSIESSAASSLSDYKTKKESESEMDKLCESIKSENLLLRQRLEALRTIEKENASLKENLKNCELKIQDMGSELDTLKSNLPPAPTGDSLKRARSNEEVKVGEEEAKGEEVKEEEVKEVEEMEHGGSRSNRKSKSTNHKTKRNRN